MPNEIYHRSNWGNANAEGFGDVYFDAAATNKLYNHSDYYENSDGTDKILKDLSNKASIVLTPTAYSDGSLNTVIPPYQVLPTELVTNGTFDTDLSGWQVKNSDATHTVTHTSDGARFQSDTTSPIMFFETIDVILQGGRKYSLTVEIVNRNSGAVKIQGNNINLFYSDNGVSTDVIEPTGDSRISFYRNTSNVDLTIKSVSVKEIQEADFDFSRGSSATRVNEKGLIEDVQILSGELVQNGNFEQIGSELVTNGNFDTDSDWTKTSTVTISNGVANIVSDGSYQYLAQSNITTQNKFYKLVYTIVSNNNGALKFSNGSVSYGGLTSTVGTHIKYFQANTGTSVYIERQAGVTDISIDNVSVKEVGQNWTFGTGWSIEDGKVYFDNPTGTEFYQSLSTNASKYRISFDLDITSGTIQTSFSSPSTSTIQSFTTSGTKTIDITTTASFSRFRFVGLGGSVFNIDNVSVIEITDDTDLPRIDYTDGTGSLLLEPQRTNFVTYSETFNNWIKVSSSVEANATIAPDGTNTADKIFATATSGGHFMYTMTTPSGGNSVISVYAKAAEYKNLRLIEIGTYSWYASIDLTNGNITNTGGLNFISASAKNVGNGWYLCTIITNKTTGSAFSVMGFPDDVEPINAPASYEGDGVSGIYIWGAQAEAGSYATSYIPTNGSTVTRAADVANNSGNSDLINSTEGVLYFEGSDFDTSYNGGICISDLTYDNRVLFYFDSSGNVRAYIFANGIQLNYTTTGLDYTINHKYAIAWKNNHMRFFVDGVMLHSQATGNAPTGMNNLSFTSATATSDKFRGNVKCVAVFKEALSDDLLERLTGEGYESFRLLAEANNYTII